MKWKEEYYNKNNNDELHGKFIEWDANGNIKTYTKRVDINVLLDKVRASKKKEKFENGIFFGLAAAVIIVTGIIISL